MKAPDFTLQNHEGKMVSLKSLLAEGPILLAFYPADFTMVCTKQLCDYRDNSEDFTKLGIRVVGISHDAVESHARFRAQHKLPFELLSDPNKKVAKAYGCQSKFILGMVSRAVFVISRDGEIVYRNVEATPISHRNSADLAPVLRDLKEKKLI